MNKKKIFFYNVGCRTNIAEIEQWVFDLDPDQFEISNEDPDYVIVNTCSVTSKAAGKSRSKVNKVINEFKNSKIIVAGCSVDNEDIHVDGDIIYVKNSEKNSLFEILDIPIKHGVSDLEFRTRQNVIIQTGCNSRCSYCIIPSLRGNEVSRNIGKILEHIHLLFTGGIKEVVLTGTNIGRYNFEGNDLYELLVQIVKITPNGARVRLSSIEPWDFDNRLIELIKNEEKICPFFHIPLQSGNSRVLKAMNRNYSLENFKKLVDAIKKAIPNSMVGTDVIVGFPDETVEEFNSTKLFLKEIQIDHFHVFSYSPRRGTVSEKNSENNVDNNTKRERVTTLLEVGKKKKADFLQTLIGSILNVIIEKKVKDSYIGKGENFADVVIENCNIDLEKGSVYRVKILSVYKNISLIAALIN